MTRSHTLSTLASLVFAGVAGLASCAGSTDDTDEPYEASDVAASATLLASADFNATSSTQTIVNHEIATNPAVKLVAVGDMSYAAPYAANDPWAAFAARTFPVMGNHEFNSVAGLGGVQPFDMFNGKNAAGNRTFAAITTPKGIASFDFTYSYEIVPGWLLVVLNTGVDCEQQACTTQATKLASTIQSYRSSHGGHGCVIVAMHTARWSTMFSGSSDNLPWATSVAPIWNAAVANHADLVLQGHVHVYEEFDKLDASGHVSAAGPKLFTVGSGGRGQVTPLSSNISASALVASHGAPINGVLKLALYPGSYGYHFETSATTGAPASSVACNVP